MKNKDIHEWLLDEGIEPLTTVTTEKGEYYLSDILEKHLTEQLHLFAVSGQSEQLCDFIEWYDESLTLEEREMEVKTYMDMKSHNCH